MFADGRLTLNAWLCRQAGSSGGEKGEDVKGAMLKPSSVNSPWVRATCVLTRDRFTFERSHLRCCRNPRARGGDCHCSCTQEALHPSLGLGDVHSQQLPACVAVDSGTVPTEHVSDPRVQVRLLAIAGAVLLASRGTALLSRRSAAFVYVLAYATWTGSNLWTTFIAGARHGYVSLW